MLKADAVPGWLSLNPEEMSAKVLREPNQEEYEQNLQPQMIVEFYSR